MRERGLWIEGTSGRATFPCVPQIRRNVLARNLNLEFILRRGRVHNVIERMRLHEKNAWRKRINRRRRRQHLLELETKPSKTGRGKNTSRKK